MPRPDTTMAVMRAMSPPAMANARKTRNQTGVSGKPISASTDPTPTMIVVPTR